MAEDMDCGDSLFEGMVLFAPSHLPQIPQSDDQPSSPSPPPPSSQPLDEDLFSDLTLQTPLPDPADPLPPPSPPPPPPPQQQQQQLPPLPSAPAAASKSSSVDSLSPEALHPPLSRQTSRKKKRAVRIGYARDTAAASSPADEVHLQLPDPLHVQPLPLNASYSSATSSYSSAAVPDSVPSAVIEPSPACGGDFSTNNAAATDGPPLPPSSELATDHQSGDGIADSSSKEAISIRVEKEDPETKEQEQDPSPSRGSTEVEDTFSSTEERLELARLQISQKLEALRQRAASISAEKKELERRRRKTADDLNSESTRFRDLEKELEQACEAEDFERAEMVSQSLSAAEKDKDKHQMTLRELELKWETIESEMQETLELQIAAEEEAAILLQKLAKDTADHAEMVLRNAEAVSMKELEEWQSSAELLETKKLEMDIKSQLISEARSGFESAIENLIEDDRKQKEILIKKGNSLSKELEELLELVRLKQAEITENNSRIQVVNERISKVVSNFHETQLNIGTKHDELMVAFSEVESENEALLKKKNEIDNFLASAEEKRRKLLELSTNTSDEGKVYQDVALLKKRFASFVLKAREDRASFAKAEEKILEDIQILRHQVSAARSTLQELSSSRASIQQEVALDKQRIEFIEKRGPELDAEKKVAAAARNFKEAARVAAEAKALNLEKEELQRKLEKYVLDLEKLEKEIQHNLDSIQESEGLIILKEQEAASVSCERLLLVAASARAERTAALKIGDLEESEILLREAETAESKAMELQEVYDLKIEVAGENFVSLAFIINLSGKDLSEMAVSFNLPAANKS